MTLHLRTPEQIESFANAIEAQIMAGKPVDLAECGPRAIYQTAHYQIVDHGDDWKGRYAHRFVMRRKPEYSKSGVMARWADGNKDAEGLIDAMHEAEKFHMENLPYCGGF